MHKAIVEHTTLKAIGLDRMNTKKRLTFGVFSGIIKKGNFMGPHLAKIMVILICSSLILTVSCQVDDSDDILQVYNENGTPFNGTFDLVGLPSVRLESGYYPWKLYGRITNGKMAIDFPDVKLVLRENVYISKVYIERKNSSSTRFGLYKPGSDNYRGVDIYYVTDDLLYEGIALKAGWNFIEELENPNWTYESDEPYVIPRFISQDINEVLQKGYRWQVEYWS